MHAVGEGSSRTLIQRDSQRLTRQGVDRVPTGTWDTDGQVTVHIDGVLVFAHSDKEDPAATWKKTYGHHP